MENRDRRNRKITSKRKNQLQAAEPPKNNGDQLPEKEIKFILRGSDYIIGRAGRTMLAKILKGSRDKKLLAISQELELHNNEAYGSLSQYTLAQITDKIDWMIRHGYLKLEYEWKMPVILFTDKGWEIEREELAKDFLDEWDRWIDNRLPVVSMSYLKDLNRGLVTLFLDKVMQTNDPKYLPLLRKWEPIDYKKVRAMIRRVIQHLESCKK
ncbi:RQC-minor-1 family DNA-binding protein [Alicyclobacillus sp. SO9]|uniref:RQC-minor-1 family DNA-binding protein n=1 Tax=Alicyclobacillus sp. SO9 TaxID=2665646 RepID=UPI0018E871A7|nr:RQC-minor-1 family DNA-binding protein [Alicyclobacillus sp. SO9]QQE79154.1 RQC domain protein [Alicyclobacillus sp. SO9]